MGKVGNDKVQPRLDLGWSRSTYLRNTVLLV
jgi:hypothetical protein